MDVSFETEIGFVEVEVEVEFEVEVEVKMYFLPFMIKFNFNKSWINLNSEGALCAASDQRLYSS